MSDTEHDPHRHGAVPAHIAHHHGPYWKRAHRDWRVWVGFIFIFIAMIIYVMSEDLAWRPGP